MAVEVDVHDAKTHFSKLLKRVMGGEEVVIAKAGRSVARLVPYAASTGDRIPARYAGQFQVPDDFDAPLPVDIQAAFEVLPFALPGGRVVSGAPPAGRPDRRSTSMT